MSRRDRHLYDFTERHDDSWAVFQWSYGASVAAEQWCHLRGVEPVSGPSQYIEDKQWLCYVFYEKADAEALVVAMGNDGFISDGKAWLTARRHGRRHLARP